MQCQPCTSHTSYVDLLRMLMCAERPALHIVVSFARVGQTPALCLGQVSNGPARIKYLAAAAYDSGGEAGDARNSDS